MNSPLGKIATDGTLAPFADLDRSAVDLAAENAVLKKLLAAKDAEIANRDTTIEQLRTQLSPDIASIVDTLLSAGLESWGEAAITAANPEDGVFRMIRDLESVAREPASWSQCDRIKQLFGLACHHSKVVPTVEQAEAMQAILDQGGSTGPVSPDRLNFHKFMGKK
jgi:hypothetical protein